MTMVVSGYKWFLLVMIAWLQTGAATINNHPLHVSTVEIEHNAAEKTLEISCRIFTDDFESILSRLYKTKVDFSNETTKSATDELVKKYIASHLAIKVEGKLQAFTLLGWEKESEAIYMYFSAAGNTTCKKVEVTTTLLHDQYTDQMNIVHVIVNGKRKSTRLNYPDKVAVFEW